MEWKTLENICLAWMQEEKKRVKSCMEALRSRGCGDDAMLEQVRLNIYEAFEGVVRAGEREKAGEEAAFCLQKFEAITAIWEEKMRIAKERGNAREVAVEAVKLETARHIREKWIGEMNH